MKRRRLIQVLFLILLNCSWGPEAKWLCTPVLNCHSCMLAWFACPIGVMQHYAGWHVFPFMALGMILMFGVSLGRLLCGWICPFGLLQDLMHKIPSPKFRLPDWTSYGKYVVLGVLVLLLPFLFGAETWFSFCRICPASALQVTLPNIATKGWPQQHALATVVRMAVLAGVLVLVVMSSRGFCKAFCPIGAILAPLNHISFWAVRAPVDNCRACGKCDRVCPVGGVPSERVQAQVSPSRDADCIVCHDCQSACPAKAKKPAAVS